MASRGGRPAAKCPHCGKPWPGRQTDWQRQARAAGRCVRCNRKKSPADERFWSCTDCRRVIAANSRKRYARKSRLPWKFTDNARRVPPKPAAI